MGTKTSPVRLDMDLDEFTGHVNDLLGYDTQLGENIRIWRRSRNVINTLGSGSVFAKELNAAMDAAVGSVGVAEGLCHGTNKRVYRRHMAAHTKTVVRSEAVKKRCPELWLAARKPSFRMGCDTKTAPVAVPKIRPGYVGKLIEAKTEAAQRLKYAREHELRVKDHLYTTTFGIEAEDGWTGNPPYALSDGWVIGWTKTQRYSEALAKEKAPEFGVDLTEITEYVTVPPRVFYVVGDLTGTEGSLEDYEGDGYAD
ncbi:hypothetical protein SEA_SHEILA_63 [Mycobacterium phage Sheila]|nr:hypothetical protein SEA_HORCHATA_64 [Mycobacterium phage Horchata]ATN91003.1 hypothetical protein SEA_MIKOTA_64 [Mycobacterium phage Mikota]ATN91812.1 hypothetical protein SEA_SHEILA_63 [Mycobacterium phage Sheila]WKW85335.1 hypothetical protein SEA_INVERNESS_65 [Mycobacterium phage Inverness]WNM69675.1 hypothetical protein SEA_MINIBOSS_64 [Mycobacterium phage MiniBoss]